MSLIHDDELGTGAKELVSTTLALDVVEADDGVRVSREDGLTGREVSLQSTGTGRSDGDSVDVEPVLELSGPLLNEVRRAKDCDPLDFAAVEQLTGDERSL